VAVYTPLEAADVGEVLRVFGLPAPDRFEPVAGGIENTTYRVRSQGREWVLTLFERDGPATVAETADLVGQLADRGVPCPRPRRGPSGPVAVVKGKPATLVPFVVGREVVRPDEARLEALGGCVAVLHRAGSALGCRRTGAHRAEVLVPLARRIAARLEGADPVTAGLLREEASAQETVEEEGLPSGVIHGDLFLDNVLFEAEVPRVAALLDFQMAGRGPWLYDVSVVLLDAAWGEGGLSGDVARAFLRGYRAVRPVVPAEWQWLPAYLRRAALRFLCLRLERFGLGEGGMRVGRAKDPLEYLEKLRVLRGWALQGAGTG
jgi:homoserine kinase type II